jgi:uncharacterized protein (TIGR00369 family)
MELTKEKLLYRAKHIIMIFNTGHCVLDNSVPLKVTDCNLYEQSIDVCVNAEENTLNLFGAMHGGIMAWIADVAMATAVSAFTGEVHGFTIDMNINYIKLIPVGAKILCRAWNQNCGNFMRRARADFFIGGKLAASCMGNYTGRKITGQNMIKNADDDSWTIINENIQCKVKGELQFNQMINFMKYFGQPPVLFFEAPIKTEIEAKHTNNPRKKLPARSIDKFIYAAVGPRNDGKVFIASEAFGKININLNEFEEKKESSKTLVRALATGLAERAEKGFQAGFNAYIISDMPLDKKL